MLAYASSLLLIYSPPLVVYSLFTSAPPLPVKPPLVLLASLMAMDINITRKSQQLSPKGCYHCEDTNYLVKDYLHCCYAASEFSAEI